MQSPKSMDRMNTLPTCQIPNWTARSIFNHGLVLIVLISAQHCSAKWQSFRPASTSSIQAIGRVYEDRHETLWFARGDGFVSSYDGLTWNVYRWPGPRINAFVDSPGGGLWAATESGLWQLAGFEWVPYSAQGSPPISNLRCAIATDNHEVWISVGTEGVMRFDGTDWHHYSVSEGLIGSSVAAILEDRDGGIWFSCDQPPGTPIDGQPGVTHFDGREFHSWPIIAITTECNSIRDIDQDEAGNLWFLTSCCELVTFRDGSFHVRTVWPACDAFEVEARGPVWLGGTSHGAARFDGHFWTKYGTRDGLIDTENIYDIYQDRAGNLWFSTNYGVSRFDSAEMEAPGDSLIPPGVPRAFLLDKEGRFWAAADSGLARLDGTHWKMFPESSMGPSKEIAQDSSGGLWVAGSSLKYFDPSTLSWRTYGQADGLPLDWGYTGITVDPQGNVWVSGSLALSRFDGVVWTNYTATDTVPSLPVRDVHCDHLGTIWLTTDVGATHLLGDGPNTFLVSGLNAIRESPNGDLWFSSGDAITKFDGTSWHRLTENDGLLSFEVTTIHVDDRSRIWVGSKLSILPNTSAVSRYDGEQWNYLTASEGLPNGHMVSIGQDFKGDLWLATERPFGILRIAPDRTPPQTVFSQPPPDPTPTRTVSFSARAAFGEADGIQFSYRINTERGGSWSPWTATGSWVVDALPEGINSIEVRSRDVDGNIDQTPGLARCTVDTAPPSPVLAPIEGERLLNGIPVVRAKVNLRGTTQDGRFRDSRLILQSLESIDTYSIPLTNGAELVPISDGPLAVWDTGTVRDGMYDLELLVTDSLGLTGTTRARVIVDNHYPPAISTSPIQLVSATGGDVFTNEGDFHLYFGPRTFLKDTKVTVTRVASLPESLPTGERRIGDGFFVEWDSGEPPRHSVRMERSLVGLDLPASRLSLQRLPSGGAWEYVGGTVIGDLIQIAITQPGTYALFSDGGGSKQSKWSKIRFTPRVFSPNGTFADREVGISFSLPRPAHVTIREFSRSGVLVRELATSTLLSAGANLVRWDGKDSHGRVVLDGVYLVTVQALGTTMKEALAVVR